LPAGPPGKGPRMPVGHRVTEPDTPSWYKRGFNQKRPKRKLERIGIPKNTPYAELRRRSPERTREVLVGGRLELLTTENGGKEGGNAENTLHNQKFDGS